MIIVIHKVHRFGIWQPSLELKVHHRLHSSINLCINNVTNLIGRFDPEMILKIDGQRTLQVGYNDLLLDDNSSFTKDLSTDQVWMTKALQCASYDTST